jgi:hypothetical protein
MAGEEGGKETDEALVVMSTGEVTTSYCFSAFKSSTVKSRFQNSILFDTVYVRDSEIGCISLAFAEVVGSGRQQVDCEIRGGD